MACAAATMRCFLRAVEGLVAAVHGRRNAAADDGTREAGHGVLIFQLALQFLAAVFRLLQIELRLLEFADGRLQVVVIPAALGWHPPQIFALERREALFRRNQTRLVFLYLLNEKTLRDIGVLAAFAQRGFHEDSQ